jgi:hypothetical protein
MIKRILLLFVLAWQGAPAQENTLQYYYTQAHQAQQAGENSRFYEMIVQASEIHPYHPTILYMRGIAATLVEKNEEALTYLRQAILMNSAFELNGEELRPLAGLQEFKLLLDLQQEMSSSVIRSDTAFVLTDRSLHIETIAAGETDNVFYLSSIHQRKILKMDKKKQVTNFTEAEQDGLTAVLGLKIDKTKKVLWACSSPMREMQHYDSTLSSAVFRYDLKSKKLLKKYWPEDGKKAYVFGDLILNAKGEAFVSDSRNNIIFKVNETSGKLENFFTDEEFWNIQGIAFSSDERYLFISDYIKGLYRLTLATKALTKISTTLPISLKSIDGLMWYQNSLVAIQNGVTPMRVMRYYLNESCELITQFEIIDQDHPAFNEPTNGCLVNDTLYYVANSQWGGYDEARLPKPVENLQDIVILKNYFRPGR